MRISLDDITCRIIAETTALLVSDFSLCFQYYRNENDYDINVAYKKHSLFIKQLVNDIIALSLNEKPYISLEKDGCGVAIWF